MYEFSEFKAHYHMDRLIAILGGENPPPVTFEIDPTNICNHNCVWCIDQHFNRANPVSIPLEVLERFLGQIAAAGVKSVVVKGGGEPLCHPEIGAVLRRARAAGLEVGLITNGELLGEHAEAVAETCTWVRVSLNGATAETHARLHRPEQPGAFERTLAGIEALAPRVFLGIVFVTAATNAPEVYEAARLAKRVGAQYLAYKMVCTSSTPKAEDAPWLAAAHGLYEMAYRDFHAGSFRIFGSAGGRGDLYNLKPVRYDLCEGPRLVGILCADARLYACCSLRFNPEYCFGSIAEASFQEVWSGERRRAVLDKIAAKRCRDVCMGRTSYMRYDHYNRLFQYLSADAGHVDFL